MQPSVPLRPSVVQVDRVSNSAFAIFGTFTDSEPFHAGMGAEPLTLASLKRSTPRTWDQTAYPSISTGEALKFTDTSRTDRSVQSDWVHLYLGKRDGTHVLTYNQFTQLMKGLQGERLRQSFKYFDQDGDGFITPDQFKRIILVRVSLPFEEHHTDCSRAGSSWPQALRTRH